jgi:[ribosomal protein S5]-alanine N-acetyltransferase
MEIFSKRFLLRDFREEDAAAFQEYHADPRSSEFYGIEEVKPGHAQQLLETFNKWATEKPRRNYQFAIIQRQGSRLLVGCCGLRTADPEASKAEFGIELAPEFWGRYGYAIEIMHALGDFGFGNLKLTLSLHKFRLLGDVRQLARPRGNATTPPGPPNWRTC